MIKNNDNIHLYNLRVIIKSKFKYEKNFYEALGVTKSTFLQYNQGRLKPTIDRCFQIANILQIEYTTVIQAYYPSEVKQNKEIVCNKMLFDKKKKGK